MSLTGTGSSATASVLLDFNYGTVSVLMVWVYEYAITFDEEVAFLKKSRWNTVKILYLVCRYLPFLCVATNTSHFVQPGLSVKACESYFFLLSCQFHVTIARSGLTVGTIDANLTIIICADMMFLVRTYALWDRTRLALAIILVNFMAFFIPIVVITALFNSAPTFIPVLGITSCSAASHSRIILLGYVLLVIGETEILLSTLYQSVQHYRVGGRGRLLTILVNHNVWYFGCSLTSSVAVILMVAFLLDPYNNLFASPQLSDDCTCDTGYSDASFPVEIGPESAKSG
ncbi:hypothetical protein BU15DRAFT_82726 [Melanogaster broomeanus]|nr:hypothetical protein BU15DRAFT_82726 [Melanogaster broomeanus]